MTQPGAPSEQTRLKIAFLYLGRNPGFGAFVFDVARAVQRMPSIDAEFFVADQTELASRLAGVGVVTVPIRTFYRRALPAAIFGFFRAHRQIFVRLARSKPDYVVTLMPHIWSPLFSSAIKRKGHVYATLIHDAEPHPGDPTAWATRWLASDARHADLVFVLSRAVADQLQARKIVEAKRIVQLFHPDLEDGRDSSTVPRASHHPFKVLLFGRILAYKGLGLLINAIEELRAKGVPVHLGVAGPGGLEPFRTRLVALDAEVIEGWVPRERLRQLLHSYDAIVCSHIEASQSGVAALAFAAGMPVIAAPVGGLAEQVIDGRTGVQATAPTALAFAEAIKRLIDDPDLYQAICRNLIATADERSADAFVSRLVGALRSGC